MVIISRMWPGESGPSDILARLMGQWLSERLGQPFVVENRPGAAANIATEAVVRAPADGYTLLLVPDTAAVNATLYDKLNFNFIRDIAPVQRLSPESLKNGDGPDDDADDPADGGDDGHHRVRMLAAIQ